MDYYYDERLVPYIKSFQSDMGLYYVPIDPPRKLVIGNGIEFDSEDTIAYCEGNYGIIKVWERWWNTASEMEKKWVLYHEMGHWLGLPHYTAELDIMNDQLPDCSSLPEVAWRLLVHNLFNPGRRETCCSSTKQ